MFYLLSAPNSYSLNLPKCFFSFCTELAYPLNWARDILFIENMKEGHVILESKKYVNLQNTSWNSVVSKQIFFVNIHFLLISKASKQLCQITASFDQSFVFIIAVFSGTWKHNLRIIWKICS